MGEYDTPLAGDGQSDSTSLVRSFATLPVFRVSAGSNSRTCASPSATGLCSTPRGTMEKLALAEVDAPLPEFDREVAVEHEEQLVGCVVVPDELAVEFGELDYLAVEFADELRRPLFVELGELRFEIDFLVFHVFSLGPRLLAPHSDTTVDAGISRAFDRDTSGMRTVCQGYEVAFSRSRHDHRSDRPD